MSGAVAMAGAAVAGGYRHLLQPGAAGDARTLVLLHGTGGDERDMLVLGRSIAPGATLLSLRGDVSEHGAARFFRRRAEGVYDMEDLERATVKLDGFLEETLRAAGRDPEQAVGIGYSNGANLLANLLFRRPERLGGWALLHPLIPFAPEIAPAEGRPVLVSAGERDPICPPELTRLLVAGLGAAGAAVREVWHPGGHAVARSELEALTDWIETL